MKHLCSGDPKVQEVGKDGKAGSAGWIFWKRISRRAQLGKLSYIRFRQNNILYDFLAL